MAHPRFRGRPDDRVLETGSAGRGARTIIGLLLAALLGMIVFAPPSTAHEDGAQLLTSARADRSAASSLSGASVSGRIHVFVDAADATRAEFWLDNQALAGQPRQVENQAPFDFAGGSATTAVAFDTGTLTDGAHVISTRITRADGHVHTFHTNFSKGTTTPPATSTTLRIDAGGTAVTTGGIPWSADQQFVGGKSYSNSQVRSITGTTDDVLYLTERSATSNRGSFSYAVRVAASGTYTVKLHFAEIYHGATGGGPGGAGRRVFSVNAEGGAAELANYDIFADVGAMTATTRTITAGVSDGTLDLAFTAAVDQPSVAALEITGPAAVTLPPPPPPAGDPSPFSWESRANAPLGRSEAQGAAVDGRMYVFGGFSSGWTTTPRSDVLDTATNAWSRLPDMPEELTHSAVVVDGRTIWLLGGYVGDHPGPATRNTWKFDTTARTWSRGPALPAARGAGGAAIVGRQLYFFSGTSRVAGSTADPDQADTWVLDLDGGTTWTAKAPLPNPRNHIAAASVDGKVYAIGGQHNENESSGLQSDVHRYDPRTDVWQEVADLPVARSHAVAEIRNGQIVLIGGTLPGNVASRDVTSYSPAADAWSQLPPLPAGRKTPVAAVVGGAVWVTGGSHSISTWTGRFSARWESGGSMPAALGEVAGGTIGKNLYLVGEGNAATLALDLSTGTWRTGLSVRPFAGHHHAAEVVNGRLHLFGGLGAGAGKHQIYDPSTNRWTLGPDMPFAAGSSSSSLIGGKVYVAGGIVGSTTTNRSAVYDPVTTTWKEIAPMPQGRNHAAATTDGRRMFVAGGRGTGSGDGNTVANGYNTLQIYDPGTNTWRSSVGSTLAPLPQARGGMGKAVYYGGEMYVLGGETQDGAGATSRRVYDRVDIYNSATNTWRAGTPMLVAKHGVFPLLVGSRITVAGGGVQAGYSSSSTVETYNP